MGSVASFSLGDLLAVCGALIAIGVQLATVSGLRAQVARLERGAADQGKRLGELDKQLTRLEERMRPRRSTSSGWPKAEEEGSADT